MCSCDTSSGRTVSAQRQAAFSSCSRGAMALARAVPPESGSRGRLRSRPTVLRHLPAMKTRRSLSQLASQSPARATAAAPARPRPPARPAAKRRRRHPTLSSPPRPQTLKSTPHRDGRMRVPGSLCASRASELTGGGEASGCQGEFCRVLFGAAGGGAPRPPVQGGVLRTTTLNKPAPRGPKAAYSCLLVLPLYL